MANAVHTTRAVDDALDLLGVVIATKLLARAERQTAEERLKTLLRVERASAKPATAFQIVFDTTSEQVDTDTGEITPPEAEALDAMWRLQEVLLSELNAVLRLERSRCVVDSSHVRT